MRRGRRQRGDHHLGRVQGDRAGGAELERQVLEQARRGRMRLIGPNCLGVMRPYGGLNATFAARIARPGHRRLHQPERRPLHGHSRLEPARECRLQRVHLDRVDARRRLGRPDRLPRRRSLHQVHRHLHGIDRRCAVVSVGLARGRADQADHRDQGGADRGGGQGGRVAHGLACRQR